MPNFDTTRAAVLTEVGIPLHLLEIGLRSPGDFEVVVQIGASGVCHSDIAVFTGAISNPLPVVLGHEGAGTVVAIGSGVSTLSIGDRVVLSWLAQCGSCFFCLRNQPSLCESATAAMARGTMLDGTTRYHIDNSDVFHMAGLGTFSELSVVPEKSAIRVPEWMGFSQAALIGCGVLTGFGAVVNSAKVQVGDSVAIFGCGGVGLSAVQAARISGASEIIAIDLHDERLQLARDLGATSTLVPSDSLAKDVRGLTDGRGVDVALEVVGRQETVDNAIKVTRRGGKVILVGAGPSDVQMRASAFTGVVVPEKTIQGSFYGSSNVQRDVAKLVSLYRSGMLKLDELISKSFSLGAANEAVQYCATEQGARAVIVF